MEGIKRKIKDRKNVISIKNLRLEEVRYDRDLSKKKMDKVYKEELNKGLNLH